MSKSATAAGSCQSATAADSYHQPHDTTNAIETAHGLYDAGMNVFPTPLGSKKPYGRHGFLNTTRLHRSDLPALCNASNLAVMTGRLSQNLVILDCDTEEAFQRVGRELQARGVAAWVRNGARGGQYWMRCAEGEIANKSEGAVDVLGNRKYALAPPSVHPTGLIYKWIARPGDAPPLVSLKQLDFLELRLATPLRARPRTGDQTLPAVAHAVLVDQDTSRYDGDNSRAEYAACLSLMGVGRSDEEILRLFWTHEPPHYCKVGASSFQRAILAKARSDYNSEHDGASRVSGIPAHSSHFVHWAQSIPWPGRTGNTDEAVFMALCLRMQLDQGQPFRASIREVSEIAGVNKDTVPSAIARLMAAGLVQREGTDKHTGAALYSLHIRQVTDPAVIRTVGLPTNPVGSSVRMLASSHDAWHPVALGKTAHYVYTTLTERGPLTEPQIAEATGRSLRSVRRALATLAEHDLAAAHGEQWRANDTTRENLDRIARERRTMGRADARHEQYRIEREKWASARMFDQKKRWQRRERSRPLPSPNSPTGTRPSRPDQSEILDSGGDRAEPLARRPDGIRTRGPLLVARELLDRLRSADSALALEQDAQLRHRLYLVLRDNPGEALGPFRELIDAAESGRLAPGPLQLNAWTAVTDPAKCVLACAATVRSILDDPDPARNWIALLPDRLNVLSALDAWRSATHP